MNELSQALLKTEAECAEGRTAPRVSLADIEANIAWEGTVTGADLATEAASQAAFAADETEERLADRFEAINPHIEALSVLTIHMIVLRNGFTVIGKSAPASPDNFDAALGAKLAKEDAIRQIWPLMGYALRDRLSQPQPFAGTDLEHGLADDPATSSRELGVIASQL